MKFEQSKYVLVRVKLIILLLTGFCIQLSSANVFGQRVTLEARHATLEQVLRKIERQSGYTFFYNRKEMTDIGPITLSVKDEGVTQTLDKLFKNKPYGYEIQEKIIVLNKKDVKPIRISVPVAATKAVDEQQLVSGRVTDSLGNPIEGVSILVQGTSRGTATDAQGRYQIQADPGDVLVVRNVGYMMQEVTVNGQTGVDVVLLEDQSDLGEVVVVAYGTQKKATITGAINSITTKEIKQSPAANLAVTLAGRLPGLTAIQRSGEPGRDATQLFLRGLGTLNGQNPIILVDGVERDLTYIDPNEVENVTILKDASSTALFGVRGANGVILVTTKRGTNNKPGIAVTAEYGLQDFTRDQSVLSSYDWARLKNEAWRNDNPDVEEGNPSNQPPYSAYALERFRLQDYPEAYPNNNWPDLLFEDFVAQSRYNLNLTGGGDYVNYFVNVGHLNQGGQWKVSPDLEYDPSSYLKRYNFRSNIDAVLNKARTLKTFLNAAGYLEKVNSPRVESAEIFRRAFNYFPVILPGPLAPNGEVLQGSGFYNENPWAHINRSGYRQDTRSNVTASWGLEQNLDILTKGLSARFMASFDTRSIYNLTASKTWERWTQIIDPNTQNAAGQDSVSYQRVSTDVENTPLSTSTSSTFESFSNFQFFVNYNRTFADRHAFTGLLLAQQEVRIRPGDRLPFNLRGLAARVSYGFDNRYHVEFNAGYNGSEQFAKGNRYGFFPSLSAGWVISNESFLANNPTITLLKIRASIGQVGSDYLGNRRFLYLDNIQMVRGGYSGTLGRGNLINESYIGNPNVRWEVANKQNVGLELGLFNELNVTLDVFNERRNNVLINRGGVPNLYGIPSGSLGPVNIGVVENRGYELEANYNKRISNDWSVLVKANFNHAKNKVIFTDEPTLVGDYAAQYRKQGYPIGQLFGYKTDGYFNSVEEIEASGLTYVGRAPRSGDFKYVDQNQDGLIDERDIIAIGYSSVPEYTFGGALSVQYKNFDLSLLFQGCLNVSGQFTGDAVFEQYDFRKRHLAAWTPDRAADGSDIHFPALSLSLSSSEQPNDFFIEDRSFIRLKNAELGYNLPAGFTSVFQSARIYVNGLNLFTWDKMQIKDYDPEVSNQNSYPVYRVFNVGVNLNF